MLPDPLHPAVVHIPLGLAFAMPLISFVVALGVRRGWFRVRTWVLVLLLQLILVSSAFVAVETGEELEENTPLAVAEELVEVHEQYGHLMLIAAAVTFLLMFGGLYPTRPVAEKFEWVSILACLIVFALAIMAGHSGGQLVY